MAAEVYNLGLVVGTALGILTPSGCYSEQAGCCFAPHEPFEERDVQAPLPPPAPCLPSTYVTITIFHDTQKGEVVACLRRFSTHHLSRIRSTFP